MFARLDRRRWAVALAALLLTALVAMTAAARAATTEPPPSGGAATTTTTAAAPQAPALPGPGGVVYKRVRGQVTGGFQTEPSRITTSAQAGGGTLHTVIVLNQTGQRAQFRLKVRDLAAGRGDTPTDLADAGSQPFSASAWVQPAVSSVMLDNLQEALVPVRVRVPGDADAGGHYAALVVETTAAEPGRTSADGPQVKTVSQIVTQVFVLVPGEVRYRAAASELEAPRLAKGSARIRFRVENRGNVHTTPRVQLVLRGLGVDRTIDNDVTELLPGGQRPVAVTWRKLPRMGRVVPKVRLTVEDGTTVTLAGDAIWVWSWPAVALLVLLGIGLLVVGPLLAWRWWSFRRAYQHLLADDEFLAEGEDAQVPP